MVDSKLRYEKLKWPEVKEAAVLDKFIVMPAGMIEDHGPHLPLDTDLVIACAICERTVEKMKGEALVAPALTHGYSPHHMDFPGPITITWETFIKHTVDVLTSFIHHGFRYILIVNGHGSNTPNLDLAARQAIVYNDRARVAVVSWWQLSSVSQLFSNIRESDVTSHACEAETSMYLAIAPELVEMDKAPKDLTLPWSDHFWTDLIGNPLRPHKNRVAMTEYWSQMTQTGVVGDATVATAEKGRRLLEAASEELCEVMREMKARPRRPRADHHR